MMVHLCAALGKALTGMNTVTRLGMTYLPASSTSFLGARTVPPATGYILSDSCESQLFLVVLLPCHQLHAQEATTLNLRQPPQCRGGRSGCFTTARLDQNDQNTVLATDLVHLCHTLMIS